MICAKTMVYSPYNWNVHNWTQPQSGPSLPPGRDTHIQLHALFMLQLLMPYCDVTDHCYNTKYYITTCSSIVRVVVEKILQEVKTWTKPQVWSQCHFTLFLLVSLNHTNISILGYTAHGKCMGVLKKRHVKEKKKGMLLHTCHNIM